MDDAHRYIPILKWKKGEQTALRHLSSNVKLTILPLLEVVDPSVRTSGGTKPDSEHLTHAAIQMEECWGTTAPILFDTHLLAKCKGVDGSSPLAYLLSRALQLGVMGVPVVSTLMLPDQLRELARRGVPHGIAIRVPVDHVLSATFPGALARMLRALGVAAGQVDFVIDVGQVGEANRETMAFSVEQALLRLPATTEWRSLTVAAAAFPINLSGIRPGVHELPRSDWNLWTSLSGVPRQPGFGDYAIAHPDIPDLDMRVVKVSANIRYTTTDSFVVARGRAVSDERHGGFSQFNALAENLVSHTAFAGASFSWGDQYIATCADGGPTGNLGTWRQVGTNHHITTVVKQLASHFGT